IELVSKELGALGYVPNISQAKKKGYSGTLTAWKDESFIREKLLPIASPDIGIDGDFVHEGRVAEVIIGKYRLLNVYIPSGSSSEVRQARKYEFMDQFFAYLSSLSPEERSRMIICGDLNI